MVVWMFGWTVNLVQTKQPDKLDAARGPSGGQLLLNKCKPNLDRPEGRVIEKIICSEFPLKI